MFIKDIYNKNKPVISLEIFPPKKESSIESIMDILEQITDTNPAFISVTYGASGNTNSIKYSQTIANVIKNQYDTEALFHFTCINTTEAFVLDVLDRLKKLNIKNILALRGDIPENYDQQNSQFKYATDLIKVIRSNSDFCIGAACYPEGHTSEENISTTIDVMKKKQDAGADFFVSQLFFENRHFINLVEKARQNNIDNPITAGIMPILSKQQINRMIYMCGVSLPGSIVKLLNKYEDSPEDLRKAGIEHSIIQAEQLIQSGVDGIHIYTMNQPDIAIQATSHLRNFI